MSNEFSKYINYYKAIERLFQEILYKIKRKRGESKTHAIVIKTVHLNKRKSYVTFLLRKSNLAAAEKVIYERGTSYFIS